MSTINTTGRLARVLPTTRQASGLPSYRCAKPRYIVTSKLPATAQHNDLRTEAPQPPHVPLRKQLKDEAKQRRTTVKKGPKFNKGSLTREWELTVGIEVHAQLNTTRKLFSQASASSSDEVNKHTAFFDLALPGSQPKFQIATLIPALRAAVALQCKIQRSSKFDRKHYFYQDQPAGYQITQYYEPLAKDGQVTLFDYDGIAPEDGDSIKIGIKQIQLEQDTAKTIQQAPDTMLLDFNRVGQPLIEIITLPHIHHPQTAAACVRKIQSILQAVNAVTTGMEMGGLRADVNVSVRRRDGDAGSHAYSGVTGLGQRTEIKNLSSFKAVEDAIIAERDRQIDVLEAGGTVQGETRGWALGSTETTRLRGKEGEVDYRYMPDPDLAPVILNSDVTASISRCLPALPDEQIRRLVDVFGVTLKDAKTLVALDGGERFDYFHDIVGILDRSSDLVPLARRSRGKIVANWTVHELGGLLSTSNTSFSQSRVPAQALASIISNLMDNRITGRSAKQLLSLVFEGDPRDVQVIIEEENLKLQALTAEEYADKARTLLLAYPDMVEKIKSKGQVGKLQFFVGQMMRQGAGKVEATKAESVLRQLLGLAD